MESTILNHLQSQGELGLGKLIENQRPHLRRFIRCRINAKLASRIDASDIIQEVYVRAYRGLNNYLNKPSVPPVVWIRQLSKQIICEIHRKNFRTVRSPFQEDDHFGERFLSQIIDSTESITSELHRKEMMEKIDRTLSSLSEIDREVIEMRHMEGYSMREIADLIGVQQETIKKRYYRALTRFREVLQ